MSLPKPKSSHYLTTRQTPTNTLISTKMRSKTNHSNYPNKIQKIKTHNNQKQTQLGEQIGKKEVYSRSFSCIKRHAEPHQIGPTSNHDADDKYRIKNNLSKRRAKNASVMSSVSSHGPLRSKVLSMHISKPYDHQNRVAPYEKFVRELNIKLPTPKQKFTEFISIPPFNRLKNHIQFISHMLQKSFDFFRMHPLEIVNKIAKKIVHVPNKDIPKNFLLLVDHGQCSYNNKTIEIGQLLVRENFQMQNFATFGQLVLIGLPYHQYLNYVDEYMRINLEQYRKFIAEIQIFKIFSESAIEKMFSSFSLHFYQKGQTLYEPGMPANDLYLVFSGSAARKIIVQIDKTNKIPLKNYTKLVKVTSRSYEHRIKFESSDLVGVLDVIDHIHNRSETIIIDENSTILAIDRIAIEQNLDDYIIDRLRKYNLKKYPRNYDQLCDKYLKQKLESKKAEERKISALKDEINKDQFNDKKNDKIHGIIKMYQDRIKLKEKEHLINHKNIERLIHHDT